MLGKSIKKRPQKVFRDHSGAFSVGEGGGDRTHDLRIKSPLLCLTELPPRRAIFLGEVTGFSCCVAFAALFLYRSSIYLVMTAIRYLTVSV